MCEAVLELARDAEVLVAECASYDRKGDVHMNFVDDMPVVRAAMKPGAHLINVARGKVVDETALIHALLSGHLGAAGLDVTREEPLPAVSPLWTMPQVLITPHTAGETQAYEDNVIDILVENLERLWRGEPRLRNEVC